MSVITSRISTERATNGRGASRRQTKGRQINNKSITYVIPPVRDTIHGDLDKPPARLWNSFCISIWADGAAGGREAAKELRSISSKFARNVNWEIGRVIKDNTPSSTHPRVAFELTRTKIGLNVFSRNYCCPNTRELIRWWFLLLATKSYKLPVHMNYLLPCGRFAINSEICCF